MSEQVMIWVPVVISRLPAARDFQKVRNYNIYESYRRIEDIRVKVRQSRIQLQGKTAEVQFELDLLLLIGDGQGNPILLRYDERLRERILLEELNPALMPSELEKLTFHLDIEHLSWDGDIRGNEFLIRYHIRYMIMASVQQVIHLHGQGLLEIHDADSNERSAEEPQIQIEEAMQENSALRRRVLVLEKDIQVLKRSLQRMEARNFDARRQLNENNGQLMDLRRELEEKEALIQDYQARLNSPAEFEEKAPGADHMRERFKRIFGFHL